MRQRWLSIFLIVAAGVLTYLCASLAGLLSIDDVGMIDFVRTGSFTLKSLFLGGASHYFRPLAVISYAGNAALWGTDPVSFHVVNIAIHIANSLLVYWLALSLAEESGDRDWFALIAALFFLVSPLNSEAVVWISARPDLLCTFFFLFALLLLVKQREQVSPCTICCFALAYLASLCSKESSIAFFGIAPLFLLLRGRREHVKQTVLLILTVFVTTGIYAFLRIGRHGMLDQGVGRVVQGVAKGGAKNADHSIILDALGAYGFYLKKLLLPFPLNFTILSYDRPAAFLSLALALIGAFYLMRRYEKALLPLLIVFLGIVPALLAYLGRIAWTPFGERYLYLPMVGFSLLVALVLADLRKVPRVALLTCLLLAAVPTMARVSLWCDGTAFWNDALQKAPAFAKSYSALGAIALDEQRYDAAEQNIKKAVSLGFDDPTAWQNLGRVYAARKDYGNYEDVMAKAASRSPHPTGIYQELIQGLVGARNGSSRSAVNAKAIKYHLLALSKDPAYLDAYYNVGKLYLSGGDLPNAARYLRLYLDSDKNGYYRPFALKMIEKTAAADHG